MSNRSTIWAQLAIPFPASGGIPFVGPDNTTIETAVQYFWWNPTTNQLSLHHAGDFSGTDTVNAYYNLDSYWPWTLAGQQALTQNGTTAGFTVSSSRGTGAAPLVSQNTDFIGKFSGWGYTGVIPFYQELGGMNVYAAGNAAAAAGLGGELRFFTKQNNGPQVEWWKIDNAGRFVPVINGVSSIGSPNNLLTPYAIYLPFVLTTLSNVVAIPTPLGRAKILAGGNSLTVANGNVSTNSIVQAQLETIDGSATGIRAVVLSGGGFIIYLTANCAADVTVSWVVWRTDT